MFTKFFISGLQILINEAKTTQVSVLRNTWARCHFALVLQPCDK